MNLYNLELSVTGFVNLIVGVGIDIIVVCRLVYSFEHRIFKFCGKINHGNPQMHTTFYLKLFNSL